MIQYLTWNYHYRPKNKKEKEFLFRLCLSSKTIYNKSLYLLRQHYFDYKKLLSLSALKVKLKEEKLYSLLSPYPAICIINDIYGVFKKFFNEQLKSKDPIKMPHYLKSDQLYPVTIRSADIVSMADNCIKLLISNKAKETSLNTNEIDETIITIPIKSGDKNICYFKLVSLFKHYWFNLQIVFRMNIDNEIAKHNVNQQNSRSLAIDLGINNLATCVTSDGKSFIVDGRYLKSINHLYNKKLAILKSNKPNQKVSTKREFFLTNSRNNKIKDAIYKAAKFIVSYTLNNNINNIIVGYNKNFKTAGIKSNLSKATKRVINQNFIQIPLAKLKNRIELLCNRYNIKYLEITESYTSLCSFYDNERIGYHYQYKGKRISRGLFKTSQGYIVNADLNAALNILAKSKTNDEQTICHLRNSGILVPKRIFINKLYIDKL